MTKVKCFRCNKKGHLAKDCPNKDSETGLFVGMAISSDVFIDSDSDLYSDSSDDDEPYYPEGEDMEPAVKRAKYESDEESTGWNTSDDEKLIEAIVKSRVDRKPLTFIDEVYPTPELVMMADSGWNEQEYKKFAEELANNPIPYKSTGESDSEDDFEPEDPSPTPVWISGMKLKRGKCYLVKKEDPGHPDNVQNTPETPDKYKLKNRPLYGQQPLTFHALTIIDMVTNLVELVRLDNKTSTHVAQQFERTWLARYPRPLNCIHDQGTEFVGYPFQQMLHQHGIQSRSTTAKNPQANAVCERMHQTVGNTLRILRTLRPLPGLPPQPPQDLLDAAIAHTMFALRCAYSTAINTTPGGLAFGRDMILNLPLHTDLLLLQQHRQQLIDQRLIVANRKRFNFDYQIGDQVLKLTPNPDKLAPRATGPFTIERVHANGTLSIRIAPHTIERISLRRVKPYHN